jgi:hypothetical protein
MVFKHDHSRTVYRSNWIELQCSQDAKAKQFEKLLLQACGSRRVIASPSTVIDNQAQDFPVPVKDSHYINCT